MDLYRDKLFIFTDGSKLLETGRTGATFLISHYEIAVKKEQWIMYGVYSRAFSNFIGITVVLRK